LWRVTTEGADFAAPQSRIAVFDNDSIVAPEELAPAF
jgi:hypothetical protein